MIITSQPITLKEAEALCWGLAQIGDYAHRKDVTDPSDPLFILLKAGWHPMAITECCEGLFLHAYARSLTEPFTELERLILRLVVEHSSWVYHYLEYFPDEKAATAEARSALRSLAGKLECLGIYINILPTD